MSKRKKKQSKQNFENEARNKMRPGQRMPFKDAMALVDDDLPDGAYWAMAHEIAGLEYGDGFDELAEDE